MPKFFIFVPLNKNLVGMNKMLFAVLMLSLMLVASCKKDSTETCTHTDTTQTFTAKVKPIIDANCAVIGCHDGGTSGRSNLSTYAGVVNAVKNQNLIQQVQTGLMPQGLPALDTSDINKIILWRDNCYQQ
jgi:hypothetical protein